MTSRSAHDASLGFGMPARACHGLAVALLSAVFTPPLVGGAWAASPRIAETTVRRAQSRDFVPERAFIVNQGDKLYPYELRFRFDPKPSTPVDFQTFTCRAVRKNGEAFRFAYRNQTISAQRAESASYHLIVPFDDVGPVGCVVGPWPNTGGARAR